MFVHRKMKSAVLEPCDKKNLTAIEIEIQTLIRLFGSLQDDRHDADYNVAENWSRSDAESTVLMASQIFDIWRRVRKEPEAQNLLLAMFGARH
jgi:hypothetical protein